MTDAPQTHAVVPVAVIRRDGGTATFKLDKIARALEAAGRATGEFDGQRAWALARQVRQRLHLRTPSIDQVQDEIERTLMDAGHFPTLRASIVYREQHRAMRQDRACGVDVERSVNAYLARMDWQVHTPARAGHALGGLMMASAGRVLANYWLNHVYPPDISHAHRDAELHLHDLDRLAAWSASWSTARLLEQGLQGVDGLAAASSPRHLGSALGQLLDTIGILQNEWAGAQTLLGFDTALAPLVRRDGLGADAVRQHLQSFIHHLNAPSHLGQATPRAHVVFDLQPAVGQKHLAPALAHIHHAWIDLMRAGDALGQPLAMPVSVFRLGPALDDPLAELPRALQAWARERNGQPRFEHTLQASLQQGSIGRVTLNCARLGYLHAGDEAGLLAATDVLLEQARHSLDIKRKMLQGLFEQGFFPFTRARRRTLTDLGATIGYTGLPELVRNFFGGGQDLSTETGAGLALRVVEHLRARAAAFTAEVGRTYALEATLSPNAARRFAREDRGRLPDILQSGTPEHPTYSGVSPALSI